MIDTAALFDLSGKSALVTGASGSLGAAASRALAAAGARVTLASGNRDALESLASELREAGASVVTVNRRPENAEACEAIVSAAEGGIDIFVSASGAAVVKPIIDMADEDWDKVIDANARQTWMMCRSIGRLFAAQDRGGSAILISSVRSRFATAAGTSVYGASKAAVDMITRSLACEWGPLGVRVNAISPTVFRSPLTNWLFEDDAEDKRREVLKRIPLGRLSEPEDFLGAIIFLASDASAFVTGQILGVDGGFSAN